MKGIVVGWALCSLMLLQTVRADVPDAPDPVVRDPFSRIQKTSTPVVRKTSTQSVSSPSLRLRAVLVAGKNSVANLDGQLLTLGQSYRGYELLAVEDSRALFKRGGSQVWIALHKESANAN